MLEVNSKDSVVANSQPVPSLNELLKNDPLLLAFFRYVSRHNLRERAAQLVGEKISSKSLSYS